MIFEAMTPLTQALEMLWTTIAPTMGRLGDHQVYQDMFRDLHEQGDPLYYLAQAFETHKVNPPIEFEWLLGTAMMVVRSEPEHPELFRDRIKQAQHNLLKLMEE